MADVTTSAAAGTEPKSLPKAMEGWNKEFTDTSATRVPTAEELSRNPDATKPEDLAKTWDCSYYSLAATDGKSTAWELKFKTQSGRYFLRSDLGEKSDFKAHEQFDKTNGGWVSVDHSSKPADRYSVTVRGQMSETLAPTATPAASSAPLSGLLIMHTLDSSKATDEDKKKYTFPAVVDGAMLMGYSVCSAKPVEKKDEKK